MQLFTLLGGLALFESELFALMYFTVTRGSQRISKRGFTISI